MPKPKRNRSIVVRSEDEHKVIKELQSLFSQLTIGFWRAAAVLHAVRERKGYKSLGYQTFQEYCEDALNKSHSMVQQLLKAYEVAIVKFSYAPENLPEYSKIHIIAEVIENAEKDVADEWIEKAKLLTAKDLRDEKREWKSGISMKDCKHPKEESTFRIVHDCSRCGDHIRRYDLEKKLFNKDMNPSK